jgi:NADPH-dependent ferric siderophore reductase
MKRIRFTSTDLHDFASDAADDHVKLFFPSGEAKPTMRDFTPRAFNPAAGTITIDFALHDAGPATQWAAQAISGQTLEIGGPRGSAIVPDDFDFYLFIGDETALPAIGRWVSELRPDVPVTTIVVVDSPAEEQYFETRSALTPIWVHRAGNTDDSALLHAALDTLTLPSGEGYIWIAAEAAVARALRTYVLEERGYRREWVKAAGYWKRGQSDVHERIED